MTEFVRPLPIKRRLMSGLPKAVAAPALACLLLGLAACGGGGGGGAPVVAPGDMPEDMTGDTPGDMSGEVQQPPPPPPPPVIGISGTVIDLDTAFTGTPEERETQYNNRERAAIQTEPGNNYVLTRDGDGEPYDTYTYWTIDGADVTAKRTQTPKGEDYTLLQRQNLAPVAPSDYSIKYYATSWSVPELDDLGIRYPVPPGDNPKSVGGYIVAAYTDKADASDTDYLEFGWWRLIDFETDSSTNPDTKEFTVRFGTYARATSSTTTDLSTVTGTATYTGSAVGYWRKTGPANANAFRDATVSLSADFGASTISGTVTNLRTSFSDPVLDDTWVITLASTSFDNQGIIAQGGTTTQDATAQGGYWKGAFQLGEDATGNAIQPPAVTGKFTAHFDDGGVTGAFAAKK